MELSRRSAIGQMLSLAAVSQLDVLVSKVWAADPEYAIAEASSGKVRGIAVDGVKIFKGIPYGGPTTGKGRFMPPSPAPKWTGVRDALKFGPTAPQQRTSQPPGVPDQGEDCLVLNICTQGLDNGRRPVMVWLHGGGFQEGSASEPAYNGFNLARVHDVVFVSVNHRLNVLGATYLGEVAGPEFASSGAVGVLDLVAALQWVRDNIERFGGDSDRVTIFGQSGGGRKVTALMAMPSAKGLFHRAIIESGALLRFPGLADASQETSLLLSELGIQPSRARELQDVPIDKLLAASQAARSKVNLREPGTADYSPVVDGLVLPAYPWDPVAPELSAKIPLIVGWARTEETAFDHPTPEKMALDEAGLRNRLKARFSADPEPVIAAFRELFPNASPWDIYILIASNDPRGTYAQEMGKRRVLELDASPTWMYRMDWETPEQGGHMHSPHSVEIPFVFNNIKTSGALISKMPEAYALEDKMSSTWVAFARTGNPNNPKIANWPAYSLPNRETFLFNDQCRVVNDPQRAARIAMEKVLNLVL